jgi:hypothetical protein
MISLELPVMGNKRVGSRRSALRPADYSLKPSWAYLGAILTYLEVILSHLEPILEAISAYLWQ